MFKIKIIFIIFVSVNLSAFLNKWYEDISRIIVSESKNFSNISKKRDLLYASLDFNINNSDSLYEISLGEDLSLMDKIYLLKVAININNFRLVDPRKLYTYYFSLILRQTEDKDKYGEIVNLYKNLDEDLQGDKNLIYLRLEASERLSNFEDGFKKILTKAFSLYNDDFLFLKWFLKEDQFFSYVFNIIKSKEDSFFTNANLDFLFKNTHLNDVNSVTFFSFLKSKVKEYNGTFSIYFLKYKLLEPDEAYKLFKQFPPKTINEYKMFYDLLEDSHIKQEFLENYKNLSGIYCIGDKNNVVMFKDGNLVSIFSGIVDYEDYDKKSDLGNEYFNKIYFKSRFPVYYENNFFNFKINYSVYPYVSTVEVHLKDKKDVYSFFFKTFKYDVFRNFNYDFAKVSIEEFLKTDILNFLISDSFNFIFPKSSVFDIRSNLISKKTYYGSDVVEIKNYVSGKLISIYKKINGSKKFNYIEIYKKNNLISKKILLDDESETYSDIE